MMNCNERLKAVQVNNYTCIKCGKKKTIRNNNYPKVVSSSCIKCDRCGGNMWEDYFINNLPEIFNIDNNDNDENKINNK